MVLATWWYEDGHPPAGEMNSLAVESDVDDELLAAMGNLPIGEVVRRRRAGNRPYVARIDGEVASYGWVGVESVSIGELGIAITLPPGNRYLWDFATLPGFRGRGIYPALLSEIIRRECPPATRLWIIHAPENQPSGVGIARAGFTPVAELSLDAEHNPALSPIDVEASSRAEAAAELLGLPLVDGDLDPCWACGGCACDHSRPTSAGGCACAIIPKRE